MSIDRLYARLASLCTDLLLHGQFYSSAIELGVHSLGTHGLDGEDFEHHLREALAAIGKESTNKGRDEKLPAAIGLSYWPCYDEVAHEWFVVIRAGSGHEGDYLAVYTADSASALWALIADKACG